VIQVVPDRRWVSFMYSYPNLIPLNAAAVKRVVAALEPFQFERIYGAFGHVVEEEGSEAVKRSAERYLKAIQPGAAIQPQHHEAVAYQPAPRALEE
jgi:hypothetical protein